MIAFGDFAVGGLRYRSLNVLVCKDSYLPDSMQMDEDEHVRRTWRIMQPHDVEQKHLVDKHADALEVCTPESLVYVDSKFPHELEL